MISGEKNRCGKLQAGQNGKRLNAKIAVAVVERQRHNVFAERALLGEGAQNLAERHDAA